jgi:hypothetical protein
MYGKPEAEINEVKRNKLINITRANITPAFRNPETQTKRKVAN